MSSTSMNGMPWKHESFIPTFQPLQHLQTYDLRGATGDTQMMATILAGLVNRPQPRVYLIINDDDDFWLRQVFADVPQTCAPQTGESAFAALLDTYHELVQGLIVYDPALLDTINVATTMAGSCNALVVASSSVLALQDKYGFSVVEDLRTYGWKSRVHAYRWAWEHLLPSSSTRIIAGLDPHAFCGLRSFLVATNAFVYWLDSRPRLADLCWWRPSERRLLQRLYRSHVNSAVHLGWFIHEPSGVALTSQSAITVIASDYCTNLEVWNSFQPSLPSLASPSLPFVHSSSQGATTGDQPDLLSAQKKIYLSFTMSDGDNLQYCQHRLLHLWQDPVRGSVPIGWTLAPVLLQLAPAMAHYYLASASENDELVAGPSGAGYLFPSNWPQEHLEALLQQTGALMQAMNMTTIEILDTDTLYKAGLPLISRVSLNGMAFTDTSAQQQFVHRLVPYGLRGVLSGAGFWFSRPRWQFVEQVPLYRNLGLADTVERALWLIKRAASAMPQRPLFLNLYVIAWSMGPAQLEQVVESLGEDYEVVLPRQLLARLSASQPDNQRSV